MLNELGQKISNALAMVNNAETIDEKVSVTGTESLPDHLTLVLCWCLRSPITHESATLSMYVIRNNFLTHAASAYPPALLCLL